MIMTEKKAKERYNDYLLSEIKGDDKQATLIENELNDAGWFITNTDKGQTVARKSTSNFPVIDDYLIPIESGKIPYSGESEDEKKKTIWVWVGVGAGIIGLIVLTFYLIKKYKKNGNSIKV